MLIQQSAVASESAGGREGGIGRREEGRMGGGGRIGRCRNLEIALLRALPTIALN